MHITIAAAPTSGANLDHEFALLKSALLYGDNITLCSHKASLFRSLSPLQEIKPDELFNLVAQLLPALSTPAATEGVTQEMADLVGAYAKGLLHKKGHLTTQQNIHRQSILRAYRQVVTNFQDTCKNYGINHLNDLLKTGRVKLHEFPEGGLDFIAADYIRFIYNAVSDGSTFPLLDDQSGTILRSFQNTVPISQVDAKRIKHVRIADSLFQRLPGFDDATLDEVVDIQAELQAPLARFRTALIEIAKQIESAVWDDDFEKELNLLVISKIEPAILEIEEQMKILPALAKYLKKPKEAFKAIAERSAYGAVIGKLSDIHGFTLAVLGAGMGAATAISQVVLEEREQASKNQMYFYYQVGKHLS
jgi:hypothetical protein